MNQGRIGKGQAIDEQLAAMGIKPSDLDLVLLSHLDCDHANGLKLVADAKKILVSKAEMEFAPRDWRIISATIRTGGKAQSRDF